MTRVVVAALLLMGLLAAGASAQQAPSKGVPALYPTKAEAEKAAGFFHCTGAHPMGDKWMPCAKHGDAHAPGH